jgi:CRISPR-associated protein Csb2
MLAVEITLLLGRYAAAAHNDRRRVEWPPHPGRFYSALVATWAEDPHPEPGEAAALDALATLPPPSLSVDWEGQPGARQGRSDATVFVPVNDAAVASAPAALARSWEKLSEAFHRMRNAEEEIESGFLSPKQEATARKEVEKAGRIIEAERTRALDWLQAGQAPPEGDRVLPEHRSRQPRTFPSISPTSPTFHFVWTDDEAMQGHLDALDGLLARLVRLGHSSSLIHARRVEQAPVPTLVPDPAGSILLRWVGPGQRRALEEAFALHGGNEPRVMPARTARYSRALADGSAPPPPTQATQGHEVLVYERVGGPRLGVEETHALARVMHRALVHFAPQLTPTTVHPAVSGRDADGSPSRAPHVAIVPLPWVGSEHATGAILGVAFLLPRELDDEGREVVLRALAAWERKSGDLDEDDPILTVHTGDRGKLELCRVRGDARRLNLQVPTWAGPSTTWVTATPMILDRNPKSLFATSPAAAARAEEAATAMIRAACQRQGLPAPSLVELSRTPLVRASEPARCFAAHLPAEAGPRRVLVHVRLTFPAPVQGPLVLGAGRFLGLGLFRPVPVPDAGVADVPSADLPPQEVP